MILDLLAGSIFLALAVCVATINILTDPKRRHWMDFPSFVRKPLFVVAMIFVFRGAQLISYGMLVGAPPLVQPSGLAALVGFLATAMCMTGYVLARTYPIRVWDRLKWIEHKVSCQSDPDEVPAMVKSSQVRDLLGGAFVAPPSYHPGAIDDAHVRAKTASLH